MHRLHPVAALHLDGRHGSPAAPARMPGRQMQVALHVVHLPQGQRDPSGKEVSKARCQRRSLKPTRSR